MPPIEAHRSTVPGAIAWTGTCRATTACTYHGVRGTASSRHAYCDGVPHPRRCVVSHWPNGGRRTTATGRSETVNRNASIAMAREPACSSKATGCIVPWRPRRFTPVELRTPSYRGGRGTEQPYGLHHTVEATVRNYRTGCHVSRGNVASLRVIQRGD